MRNNIKSIIAQALGVEIGDIAETRRLREDLGLDISELTDIVIHLNQEKGSAIPLESLGELSTVGDLLDLAETYVPEEI